MRLSSCAASVGMQRGSLSWNPLSVVFSALNPELWTVNPKP